MVVLAACTSPSRLLATPTPDVPRLAEGHVLDLVAATIRAPGNRADFLTHAEADYLGRGEWTVYFGTGASWTVIELDQVEPLTELAREYAEDPAD